ncbi:hypothetical protein N7G274_005593 [Stereocaulon virgatum]|uniref:Uncharacterized protein n=1 Tax=Stereocaulon virgatum TaxID=373712 RepID=A0ABR4AAP8_9LECA
MFQSIFRAISPSPRAPAKPQLSPYNVSRQPKLNPVSTIPISLSTPAPEATQNKHSHNKSNINLKIQQSSSQFASMITAYFRTIHILDHVGSSIQPPLNSDDNTRLRYYALKHLLIH